MKGKLQIHGHSYALLLQEKLVAFAHPEDFSKDEYVIGALALENCQAIELGYDLDELAEESAKGLLEPMMRATAAIHFKAGFFKALELLSNKKFSEQDMRRSFNRAYGMYEYLEKDILDGVFENFIQQLDSTEWDVEIVMEPALKDCREGETNYFVPATDKNGCLILKPIV